MSRENDKPGPPKVLKDWAELIIPILVGTAAPLGNLTYQALPLAPGLRLMGTPLAVAACFLAWSLAHGWGAERDRIWRGRLTPSLGWFGVFLLLFFGYQFGVPYLERNPPAEWWVNRLFDFAQVFVYACVFAALCVSLTVAWAGPSGKPGAGGESPAPVKKS